MVGGEMFEILVRKQFSSVFVKRTSIPLKVSYCDSSLVKSQPNIKALIENDFSRVVKKPFKKNFVENLFINKFEAEVLEYPQIDTIEEVQRLKKYCQYAQKLILGKTDTENALSVVDSKKAVSTLKKYELTGFKIPRVNDGFGFLSSEYSYMQETLGVDPSLSKTVCENEDFGTQLIDLFGSDVQKEQYLRKLISGENVSSFAHLETGNFIPFGQTELSTSAVFSSDDQNYIISGSKNWVYNANVADLFILSAYIKNSNEGEASKPTLFLINRNTPGVEVHEPIETLGMKNLNICNVTFNNVVVPSSCILGNINEGGEIIKKILCKGKMNNGGQCLALMKKLVNISIKHCIWNEFFNKDKYTMDSYRIKIGEMAAKVYVVESMTYLLTGRFDSHTDPDVYLESLIVKVFSSEALQFIIKEALEIIGNEFYTSDENLIELVKDSQFYIACDDTNDHLRLILASAGLKYAMSYEAKPLEKLSNFFYLLKWNKNFGRDEKILHGDDLHGYVHLMFQRECWLVEDSVDILESCTRYLIKTYGGDVFHKYLELKYLADVAINIYAMAATLGRASRAYCLAVQFHEMDRFSTEISVRTLAVQNRKTKNLIRNLNIFNSSSQISSSIMNSNKYSDQYSVVENLKVRNQNNKALMKQ